ncbi:hypothetical protein [Mycolicibacterium tusciae]|uniref:hypothetical protein n=1 Tax=Mycolicibacterium tusciae TaxID=75922 RepID=UPI00024A12F3|nr:hypothetical protein [Mycolicibacterium tusciae]
MNDEFIRTYSLEEVADMICGDEMRDPVLWVKRRIRKGAFRAIKVGRSYRMTSEQLDEALKALEFKPTPVAPQAHPSGLTRAALRRRGML